MNKEIKQALDNITLGSNTLESQTKQFQEDYNLVVNTIEHLEIEFNSVKDFKYHYDRYKQELTNKLKTINCMQEEATTNYNLIEQLEDRNDRLVERLEKQKGQITFLRFENANLLGEPFIPNSNKPKVVELYSLNENDITDLVKFAQILSRNARVSVGLRTYGNISIAIYDNNHDEFDLVKKVVEKYGININSSIKRLSL